MNQIDPLRAFGLLGGADLEGQASRELGHDQSLVHGPPSLGELLDRRFRLLRPLGKGGMGTVFLGRDEELEREVAIKVLSKGGEAARQRFTREAEVTAQLSHPHVIRIHGSGQVRGHPYLVYELIPGGRSLEEAYRELPLEARLDLLEQVAAGLAAAHEVGIVHRDLKPENVMVRPGGTAVVVDFGLAGVGESSLTRTGQTMGTPAYMAPEQIAGQPATPACDVWALGLLLYEALFEDHAFLDEGSNLQVLLTRIYEARIELPAGGPPALRRLVEATLVSEPEARAPNASAFLEQLRAARQTAPRTLAWGGALAVALALALVSLAGAWVATSGAQPSPTPSPSLGSREDPSPEPSLATPQATLPHNAPHSVAWPRAAAFAGEHLVLLGRKSLTVLDLEGRVRLRREGHFNLIRQFSDSLWLNEGDRALRLGADLALEEKFPSALADCDPARGEVLVPIHEGVEVRRLGGELVRELKVDPPAPLVAAYLLPHHIMVSVREPTTRNYFAAREDPASVLDYRPLLPDYARVAEISADRKRVAFGSGSGWVLFGDSSTLDLSPLRRDREGGGLANISVQPHNNKVAGIMLRGSRLLSYSRPKETDAGEAILWDLLTGEPKSIRDTQGIHAIALSPGGRVAVVGPTHVEFVALEEFR